MTSGVENVVCTEAVISLVVFCCLQYTPTAPSPVVDSPSWPNISEEERKNDKDAGLPLPDVDKDTGVCRLLKAIVMASVKPLHFAIFSSNYL